MSKMTTRRKLAIASWTSPKEGNIYGKLTVDATKALEYIDHLNANSGEKVTITHLVGKIVAEALKKTPSLNGYIRLGRYIPHQTVDVAFLVNLEGGQNLAKAKITNADQKSVLQIAAELRELAERLRKGKDENFQKSQGPLNWMPTWLLRPIVWFTGFLTASLGISVKALGLEAFPFGSCIVTSVGMLGIDEGFAPPTPWARVPLYVLVCTIRDQVHVENGEIVVRPMLTITATIDHRFVDGYQAATLANTARELLSNPWLLEQQHQEQTPAA
jgi:pyruvate dehydrogenase E2 component (dihydrolipoamide acetyltransferase)